MKRLVLLFLSFSLVYACNKKQQMAIQDSMPIIQKTDDEKVEVKIAKIILHKASKKTVENWQEYQAIAEFIPKFYQTSTKEILFNSNQLATLTQQLKDSIRIKKFKIPSFKMRLNVLHNEAMRIFDMDSIPSITSKEIKKENQKVIEAFNAINMKINAMVKKELLVKDLSEFNHLFKTKEDSIIKEKRKSSKHKAKIKTQKKLLKRIQPLSKKK